MELKIERFKDIASLVTEKDELRRRHDEWKSRQQELRDFYNGRPIMTEEEADEENLEEITNHLIGYSNMQVIETRLYSIWSTSNKFIEIDVLDEDLDVAERDHQSNVITKAINRAIYKSTRFGAFCRAVAGEISMAGRAACIHREDADWCPSVVPKLFLPDNVGTDAADLTYAFAPVELTYNQLREMLDDDEDEMEDDKDVDEDAVGNSVEINRPIIKQLMDTIDQQIELNETQLNVATENEDHDRTNSDDYRRNNRTTVNLWYYYEVRFDEDEDSKVVDLVIFSDEFRNTEEGPEGTKVTQEIVAYYPAYYSHPNEWLHLIVIDASIGGDKKFATAKGIAEITYNSDVDSEELLNRIFAGEKMRAVPRFQQGAEANEDKLLGWNPQDSTLVPEGISEFRFGGATGGLQNPLSLFRQNASSQSGGGHSNSGREGELRTQSIERQANSNAAHNSRVSDLYKSMEVIAHEIVRRFFIGETDGGSPGYEEIMWFRMRMEKEDVNLERLAETTFGFYDNIQVKVVKSSSTGEVDQDVQIAEQLMRNIPNYPPAVRPIIIRKYTALITGDPQFADDLLEILPKIVSAQRVTAESEFEQIARDASIGVDTPLGEDDVHTEHAVTHNKHLAVIINRSMLRPWTREDATHFAGMQTHQQLHINELLLNDTTRAEGEQLLREFQQLVNDADELLQQVQRAELEAEGRSEKEIEIQLKIAEQQRKQRETDIREADTRSNIELRERRREDVRRKGDQQFLIQKEKLDRESRNPQ